MRHLLVLALAAIGAPAQATPAGEAKQALRALQDICVTRRADQTEVLAAAEGMGWRPVPEGAQPTMFGLKPALDALHLAKTTYRWNGSEARPMVLVVGGGGEAGDGCGVAFHAPVRVARTIMSLWIGFRPFEQQGPGHSVWVYAEQNGRKFSLKRLNGALNQELAEQAARAGSLRTMLAGSPDPASLRVPLLGAPEASLTPAG